MAFFGDVDAIGIVERHIQEVRSLEDKEARKLMRRYKEVRQDLRDRLDAVSGDTFTAQQLRGTLVQVEAAILSMKQALKEGMTESANVLGNRGVENLLSEIRRFQKEFRGAVTPVNLNAQLVMNEATNFRLAQYESSLDAYGADLIAGITQRLSEAALAGASLPQTVRGLGQFFLGEEWKLMRIARTELHGVYNLAKQRGMLDAREEFIPGLKKTLIHPMDSRTGEDSKALAKSNPIVDIDKPFVFKWRGEERRFMTPPDRPNDRAILVPYHSEWDSEEAVAV